MSSSRFRKWYVPHPVYDSTHTDLRKIYNGRKTDLCGVILFGTEGIIDHLNPEATCSQNTQRQITPSIEIKAAMSTSMNTFPLDNQTLGLLRNYKPFNLLPKSEIVRMSFDFQNLY